MPVFRLVCPWPACLEHGRHSGQSCLSTVKNIWLLLYWIAAVIRSVNRATFCQNYPAPPVYDVTESTSRTMNIVRFPRNRHPIPAQTGDQVDMNWYHSRHWNEWSGMSVMCVECAQFLSSTFDAHWSHSTDATDHFRFLVYLTMVFQLQGLSVWRRMGRKIKHEWASPENGTSYSLLFPGRYSLKGLSITGHPVLVPWRHQEITFLPDVLARSLEKFLTDSFVQDVYFFAEQLASMA
jgi:hypothetical protein